MTTCPRCGAVKPAAVDVCIWCAAELGRDVRPGSAYAEGFSHPGPGLGPRWYPDGSTGPGVRPAGPNGEPPAPPPPGTRHAPGAVAGPAAPTGRTGRKAWPWLVTAAVAVLAVLAVLFGTGVLPVPGRGAAPAPPTSAPSAPTSPPPGSDPNTDPPGTSIGAADPPGLANGGTFRLAGLQLPATSMNPLDPGSYAAPLGRDIDAFRAAFPIFVRFGADGRPAWAPAYVIGAEVLSAAPTRVRIDLNPKAVWGDGTPLRATDVAEVWRRCGSADTCARADVWSGVTDVRAGSSPQQVLVDYKGADGEWQRPFALVSAMRPEAARADAKAWQQPPAAWQSGPFLIEKASLSGASPPWNWAGIPCGGGKSRGWTGSC